ncbi:MAG: hypothetical protein F4190_02165 [Acidimicrobiales bacterium]|nr:hypothetical protein [Acidimicrobiales bacterium]MYI28059.1 hypothetical protein [Acidimicrobiales bacterium]
MRILIIDDDEASIIEIRETIEQDFEGTSCRHIGFDEAASVIEEYRPSLVILDLWQGQLDEEDNAGVAFLEQIWQVQFCPVIVHSALPDIAEDYDSPFLRRVNKGGEGAPQVIEAIHDLQPQIAALEQAETEIRNRLSVAVREVANESFDHIDDPDHRLEVLIRMSRRRLSAQFESPDTDEERQPWEQYIHPPISACLLLGDVLRMHDHDAADPNSYRLVLTPSCDLVAFGSQKPKVDEILVAQCESVSDGLKRFSLPTRDAQKLDRRLRADLLNAGYADGIIVLPEFKPHIPLMVANCRSLELLPISNAEVTDLPYERVASLDSPFRELVSWAYTNVSARVGLPVRRLDEWINQLADQLRDVATS